MRECMCHRPVENKIRAQSRTRACILECVELKTYLNINTQIVVYSNVSTELGSQQ